MAKSTGTRSTTPGVAVLHDAVLHHFFLGGRDEREYVAEFVYNYGHWSEDLARELWRRRSRSAADPEYFRYPMIKRIAERSRAVIVHNPRAAALVQEHVRGTTVHEIPHLFALPADLPSQSEVIRWRAELGDCAAHVPGRRVRPFARVQALAGAAPGFPARAPVGRHDAAGGGRFRFVRSGSRRRTAACATTRGSVRVGYLDERDFWLCAVRRGCLHQPALSHGGRNFGDRDSADGPGKDRAGERAARKPSRFPEAACVRVDPGQAEEEMLAEYLVWLARSPDDARAIGQRAAEHIRQHHAPARVAELYWQRPDGLLP